MTHIKIHKKPPKIEQPFDEENFYDNDPAFADYNDEFNDADFSDNDSAFDTDYIDNPNDFDSDPNDELPFDEFKAAPTPIKPNISVIPLTPDDIQQQINKKVASLSEQLDLDNNKCLLLLRHHKWNASIIIDRYFANADKLLTTAGICIAPKSEQEIKQEKIKRKQIECGICLDDKNIHDMYNLNCGHITTCKLCWIDYLRNAVKTKRCINLTCPSHKCQVIIQSNVWSLFLAEKHKNEFQRYLRFCNENFVENSKEFVFCPGKACHMIYRSEIGIAKEIRCRSCQYHFCYKCQNESHFPASCHIGDKWITKGCAESENIQWIMAKCKKCPKCRVHIEKNQGCNHMTCRTAVGGCGYEFCWLCKGDWKKHNSSTGGYYQCNIYEKNKADGILDVEEKQSINASNELERYVFHYTRFDSHNRSSKHAIKQRENVLQKMHEVAAKFKWDLREAQFLCDAIDEVIECWHVLAWTYPISYYSNTKNECYDKSFNIHIFNEQQSFLENFCDGLQEKLDFDLEKLGDIKIRQSVIDYTKAAKKYRKNIVKDIESILF